MLWIVVGIISIFNGIYPAYIRPIFYDLPKGDIKWMWIFLSIMYFALGSFYRRKKDKEEGDNNESDS